MDVGLRVVHAVQGKGGGVQIALGVDSGVNELLNSGCARRARAPGGLRRAAAQLGRRWRRTPAAAGDLREMLAQPRAASGQDQPASEAASTTSVSASESMYAARPNCVVFCVATGGAMLM